jgi:hypothetical protein
MLFCLYKIRSGRRFQFSVFYLWGRHQRTYTESFCETVLFCFPTVSLVRYGAQEEVDSNRWP